MHKSNKPENLGQCGRQNMLRPYLRIWEWERNFGRSVKAFSPGVRSPWSCLIFSDNINLIDLIDSIDLSLRCSNVQFRIWQLPGGAFKSEISGKMTLSDISLQRHNQINRQHDRPAATRIQIYVNHDTLQPNCNIILHA